MLANVWAFIKANVVFLGLLAVVGLVAIVGWFHPFGWFAPTVPASAQQVQPQAQIPQQPVQQIPQQPAAQPQQVPVQQQVVQPQQQQVRPLSGSCPQPGEVWSVIGVTGTKVGSEPCAFAFNTGRKDVYIDVTCPVGFICTTSEAPSGHIFVWEGDGRAVRSKAATWRPHQGNPGLNVCDQWRREHDFGASQEPRFDEIVFFRPSAGVNCPGLPQRQVGQRSCPTSSQEAATQVGGDGSNWTQLDETSWKYRGPMVELSWPGYGRIDYGVETSPGIWKEAHLTSTGSITVDQATLKCQP